MSRLDPHSYADLSQGKVRSLQLELRADFSAQILEGEATLLLEEPSPGGPLDLDSRGLQISAVLPLRGDFLSSPDSLTKTTIGAGHLPFELHPDPSAPWMGERLSVLLPAGARGLTIRYKTSPDAKVRAAVAARSADRGRRASNFSSRSARRSTRDRSSRCKTRRECASPTPPRCTSRGRCSRGWRQKSLGRKPSRFDIELACDEFEMPQPIPPYLLALAVGELEERALDQRSSVIAEPGSWSKRPPTNWLGSQR